MGEAIDDSALPMTHGNDSERTPYEQERNIRLFVRGLRGDGTVLRYETPYTGLHQKCPLCLKSILRLVLTEHIMTSCECPRMINEVVIIVAPDGHPEPHWEND